MSDVNPCSSGLQRPQVLRVLAVAAAFAEGETVMQGLEELRVKEVIREEYKEYHIGYLPVVRMVTHLDVDDEGIERTIAAFASFSY